MLKDTLESGRELTDPALERLLPRASQYPISIHRAMRHSVFVVANGFVPFCAWRPADDCRLRPAGIEELGARSRCCIHIR